MARKRKQPDQKAEKFPLRLEWRSPAELAENPRNWRTHPENQQAALAGAMTEVGWAGACLFNEATGRLIDGHLRRKVAQAQGCDLVPVLVGTWTEDQEAKILATLDPLAGMAGADPVILDDLLKGVHTGCDDLRDMLTDLWDDVQADAIAGTEPADPVDAEPQTDRAEELRKKWGTAAGQLWTLGKHRLLCGDCRRAEDMARVCGGDKVNVAFTSPPYASQRKYDESSGFKPIPADEYVAWWEPVQANVRKHLAGDGSFFVNIKPHCEDGERVLYVFDLVLAMKKRWGWRFVDELCWLRPAMPGAFGERFKNGWEPVFHFSLSPPKFCPENVLHETTAAFEYADQKAAGKTMRVSGLDGSGQGKGGAVNSPVNQHDGLARPSNVLDIKSAADSVGHAAAFPVGLPSFFYRAFSDEGDIVADPFMGSGTSIIAAENLNRRCFGIEISPAYCAVILQRFADAFPGQEIRRAD